MLLLLLLLLLLSLEGGGLEEMRRRHVRMKCCGVPRAEVGSSRVCAPYMVVRVCACV